MCKLPEGADGSFSDFLLQLVGSSVDKRRRGFNGGIWFQSFSRLHESKLQALSQRINNTEDTATEEDLWYCEFALGQGLAQRPF